MRRCEHPKKVDQRWNDNFQEDESVPSTRETARYRDEDKENKAKSGPRTESAFDVRMPETTSAQKVPQRVTASLREVPHKGKTRGPVRVKTRLRRRTSQGKYKVVNYVDKKTWSGTQISSR